ncbi:MAG: glycyl-radical enzyme activating protein [Desulfobacteraceae bacterium]|nr:glycyl-radical enzyme activating protein [Desulfobacteraceae bacterium]
MEQAPRGIIFDIQRYSIHDGPGIRTTVFFKGCPLGCFWCQNPESQSNEAEVFLIRSNCRLCGRCVAVCPTGASSLLEDSSAIDRSKCIGCGKCVEVCPGEARKLVGSYVTKDEVMREVMKDVKFYENPGGGVTLSGGDPTAQPEFALSILQSSKEEDLHTVLDTCGYVAWSTMKRLLEYTDLVFLDIKIIDAAKHLKATGRDNRLILENAKRIAGYRQMRVRVPMIPNFNDSPEDVRAITRFVREELGGIDMDLLPYNKLGEMKYKRLGKRCFTAEAQSDEEMQWLEAFVSKELKRT